MALVTVDDLNAYSGNFETAAYKTTLIEAASDIVVKYLGYNPLQAERTYRTVGWGNDFVILPVPEVSVVASLVVDGETWPPTDYLAIVDPVSGRTRLELTSKTFLRGAKIVITYTAGYTDIPEQIKLAVLRIASLLMTEANGNIGVTSKSFADMSRTFVNYTNFDKYLKPLARYRAEEI